MKKFLALILAVMMMALVVTSCSGDTSTDESSGGTDGSIKIGVLAPLTGDVSVYGNAAVNGINLAVKEVNANGGVLGQQIELVTLDEKGDVNEAMTAFNNLASQGVVAVIGDVNHKAVYSCFRARSGDRHAYAHAYRYGSLKSLKQATMCSGHALQIRIRARSWLNFLHRISELRLLQL